MTMIVVIMFMVVVMTVMVMTLDDGGDNLVLPQYMMFQMIFFIMFLSLQKEHSKS